MTLRKPSPERPRKAEFRYGSQQARASSASVSYQPLVTPGTTLSDGVQIDARLGRGGMSEVWRATTAAGESVALKIPRTDLRTRSVASALSRREFRVLESLSHAHVLRSLRLIAVQEMPGLITEYLEGGDLAPLLGTHPRHWARAAREVALALGYIHERGKVHRDVKARNVLFSGAGDVRLVDFALAADAGGHAPRGGGTAAYASLAQRQGASPAVADDVHAFAVLLYELLAGRLPFGVSPPLDVLQAEPSSPLAMPDGPDPESRALAELVQQTLSPGQQSAPRGVRPFQDVLESMLLAYA